MRTALRAAGSILTALGAVVGVLTVVMLLLVSTGKVATLHVSTGSMAPVFDAGDLLVSTPIDAADIAVGDVITATSADNTLVTHRVIDVEDGLEEGTRLVSMQGDANDVPDVAPYVIDTALEMRAVVPHGAEIFTFLTTGPVPWLVGLVLACLFAMTFLFPGSGKPEPAGEAQDDLQAEGADDSQRRDARHRASVS